MESTLVWREGMNQWSHARDVVEVAALFPATPIMANQSAPVPSTRDADATPAPFFGPRPGSPLPTTAPDNDSSPRFSFSHVYSFTASILNQHFGKIFASTLTLVAPTVMMELISGIFSIIFKKLPEPEIELIVALLTLLIFFCLFSISTFFQLGQTRYILQLVRGQNPSFKTIFSEGKTLMSFLWTSTISSIIVFVGLMCFILPGIVIAMRLIFIAQICVDEGLSGLTAIKRSFELTKGHTGALLILSTITVAIFFVGCLTLIGMVWILPFIVCLPNIGYLLLRGEKTSTLR